MAAINENDMIIHVLEKINFHKGEVEKYESVLSLFTTHLKPNNKKDHKYDVLESIVKILRNNIST